jgi:hypothetical protein
MRIQSLGAPGAIVALTLLASAARADEPAAMTLIASDAAIKWQPAPPSLPKGTQLVVLKNQWSG